MKTDYAKNFFVSRDNKHPKKAFGQKALALIFLAGPGRGSHFDINGITGLFYCNYRRGTY